MVNKKNEEEIILRRFIEAYKEQIDSYANFEILKESIVQHKFPKYNNENPDFVVKLNGLFIGIELFELIRNNIEELNKSASEKSFDLKNAAHLHSIREKEKSHNLYLMEDLAIAALDRINDKIQNKLKNYIKCPIWLIGYAAKSYNIHLLSPYFDDKIEKEVGEYISKHVLKGDRVQKIFLAEFSGRSLLLEIK